VKLDGIHRLGVAAAFGIVNAAQAAEDVPPPPPATETAAPAARPGTAGDCTNCGAVRSIRSIERERAAGREISPYMTSEQYLDTRRYSEPRVGPVFGMTFGHGQETRTFVGAAGSSTMRQRILEIVYEVTVRFDDGRYGMVEMNDASGYRVGDRVRVVDNALELLPRE
jgi:hypothetical protein